MYFYLLITDISVKSNTSINLEKCETKRKLLRKWPKNGSLNKCKEEQRPQNECTSLKSFQIKSKTFICKNKSSENNNNNDSITDIQSIKKCLENSSSAIKKFDQLQSLVLVNLTLTPIGMQIYRTFFRDYQNRRLSSDKPLYKLLLIMIYWALNAEVITS